MKTLLTLPCAAQLLAREFARQKSRECGTCFVPMPFWGPAPGGISGLWYLRALEPCVHGCHTLVARIWVDITGAHDIAYAPAHYRAPKTRRQKAYSRG